MRKIEENMINAIRNGRNWCGGNTQVSHDPVIDGTEVEIRLHAHLIAKCFKDGEWQVSLCGWNTPTTRSRLKAIIRAHAHGVESGRYPKGLGVSSRNGVIRIHDARGETVIDADGWHKVVL